MLAIRMQRTGRKGHAEFRVIVQEAALSPTSGRVVARVGHHNPHTKETVLDTEKVDFYLKNGAQPSERVVRLLKTEKIKLPSWVADIDTKKEGKIRNPDKLRRNRPDEPAEPEVATEANEAQPGSDADASTDLEKPADEAPEEKVEEPERSDAEKPEINDAQTKTDSDATTEDEKPAAESSNEKPEEAAPEAEAEKPEESEAPAEDKSQAESADSDEASEEKPAE